jgi:hypothetical protein
MMTPSILIDNTIREVLARNSDELLEWETRTNAALDFKRSSKSDIAPNKVSNTSIQTTDTSSTAALVNTRTGGNTSSSLNPISSNSQQVRESSSSRNIVIIGSTPSVTTAKKIPTIRKFFDLTKD